MKILHVLYQSLPQISGSSIRSRDLMMAQKEAGMTVKAITSPFQYGAGAKDIIHDIEYIRTSNNVSYQISDAKSSLVKQIFKSIKMLGFILKLNKCINEFKPDILHAHAMFFCGIPTLILSKIHKKPFVYELRSLWMLNKTDISNNYLQDRKENIMLSIELWVMRSANSVIVINQNLKDYIVNKGIKQSKIYVINNAVNLSLISSNTKNSTTRFNQRFGYIGTLTTHEGLDMLVASFKKINIKHPQTKLYIYGSGITYDKIKTLASNNANINLKGSILPEEISKAYSNIDVIVNPRYKNELTDSVTPLKPLEALGYQKIFIGSDVGGIKEIITHGENGFLFKSGSEKALTEIMESVISFSVQKSALVKERALNYIKDNKSWQANALLYHKLYVTLLN